MLRHGVQDCVESGEEIMLFALPSARGFDKTLFWQHLLLHKTPYQPAELTLSDVVMDVHDADTFDALLSAVRTKIHTKRTVRGDACSPLSVGSHDVAVCGDAGVW
jgi:hypothetical protein